ncbi:penicillin-binding protein activator [Komagataeibacter diospyri]|uniref:Amino acid ABC transporter substrate-binding protein n=1 Tax=Komagataeibacter diospyri TaxID=1932662 RepID=A0A4P5NXH2_9PROT|nr:penicillin-binding protein activator [Komagataeibacter diospyri]GCE82810.1 amino acid ABC transporter substrate-binding protein [Komagataeibacter diospyri]GCE89557.1 amino acid ABC transporter substrate-binding protein [Komagataeibacter diospyri]
MRRQTFGTQMQGQDVDSASSRLACKRLLFAGLALSALTACASGGGHHHAPKAGRNVGVLLPLTGANARLGQEMLTATRMAMNTPTAPPLDVHDTAAPGSTAATAAQAAVTAGDGLILGPLTTDDTAAAAPVATAAHVPMLAFTSDMSVAQPGVWTLGIAPEQQVRRMVLAARQQGRQHFAAFLPENRLGHALGQALQQVCAENGLQSPQIVYHESLQASVTAGLKTLSAYETRAAAVPQPDAQAELPQTDTAVDPANPDGAPPAAASDQPPAVPAATPDFPAPPFDALLLGDTGLQLGMVINALAETHVDSTHVQIMGPGLWGAFVSKLSALQGAWYAAPDPASRQAFVQQFMARYHHMPTPLADLTYDSAALVKALDQNRPAGSTNGYSVQALTRPEGFGGVDGAFGFLEDGKTRRDLAVFQILPSGGSRIVIPPAGKLRRSAN